MGNIGIFIKFIMNIHSFFIIKKLNNEVNETEKKTIENLVKKLADLVDFIVTQ